MPRILVFALLTAASAFSDEKSHVVKNRALAAEHAAKIAARIGAEATRLPVDEVIATAMGIEGFTGLVKAKTNYGSADDHVDGGGGVKSVLYVEATGPPQRFVLTNKESKEDELVVNIETGQSIVWDNLRYSHRVDAHPASVRKMLGPIGRGYLPGQRRLQEGGIDQFPDTPPGTSPYEIQYEGPCKPCVWTAWDWTDNPGSYVNHPDGYYNDNWPGPGQHVLEGIVGYAVDGHPDQGTCGGPPNQPGQTENLELCVPCGAPVPLDVDIHIKQEYNETYCHAKDTSSSSQRRGPLFGNYKAPFANGCCWTQTSDEDPEVDNVGPRTGASSEES